MILEDPPKCFRLDDDAVIFGNIKTVVRGFGSKGSDEGDGECMEIYFNRRTNRVFVWRPDDCKI